MAAAVALWVVCCVLIWRLAGPISDEAVGGLLAKTTFPGLIVALIARASTKRWRWWSYLLAVIGMSIALNMLAFNSRR